MVLDCSLYTSLLSLWLVLNFLEVHVPNCTNCQIAVQVIPAACAVGDSFKCFTDSAFVYISQYFTFLYFVQPVILGAEYSILCYLSKFFHVHVALPVTETSWLHYTQLLFFLHFAWPCNCAIRVFLRKDRFSETSFPHGHIFLRTCGFTDIQRKWTFILLFFLIPFMKMRTAYFLVSAIFSLQSQPVSLCSLQSNGKWALFYLYSE